MPKILAYSYGGLAALYLLSGRWGLDRLTGGEPKEFNALPIGEEVRFWVVVLLGTGLLVRARRRPEIRFPVRFLVSIIALFAYLLLSWGWAPNDAMAATKAYEVLLVTVSTLSVARLATRVNGDHVLTGMLVCIFVAAGIAAMIGLAAIGTGASADRLAILGGGPNVFARVMGLLVIISLYWARVRERAVWLLPLASVAALLVLLSGSRGGLLALAVAVAVYVVREIRNAKRLAFTGFAAGSLFAVVLSSTAVGRAGVDLYQDRFQRLLLEERYTSGRGELYGAALELGASAPVLGAGLSGFPALGYGVYPHNMFLELFCEAGTVGVLLLLCVFAAAWVDAPQQSMGRDVASVVGCVLFLVAAQFSGDFYDCRGVFLFLTFASCIPAVRQRSHNTKSRGMPLRETRPLFPRYVGMGMNSERTSVK